MKYKVGRILIILGCGLITAALALFLWNRQEQRNAAAASQEAIAKVVEVIREQEKLEASTEPEPVPTIPVYYPIPTAPEERTMTVVEIDGYGYIGYIEIPSLMLELPVMTDWSYAQLHIAPCRYSGSIFTDDIVIMAHNYPVHFGRLKDMRTEDLVIFTDMDGNSMEYRVVALEVLGANAVDDMTSGDFDLTLFTCTYGGENRIAVRCDRVEE